MFYLVRRSFGNNTPTVVLILNNRRCVINIDNNLRIMKYKLVRNHYHINSFGLNCLSICAVSKKDKQEFDWARTKQYHIIGKY